jgi:phospholipase C
VFGSLIAGVHAQPRGRTQKIHGSDIGANRSFDHFLGWLPGANGRQAGLTYLDSQGEAHPTHRLTTFVGRSHPDPDHSYAVGRSEFDSGKMDGWLRTTKNNTLSMVLDYLGFSILCVVY